MKKLALIAAAVAGSALSSGVAFAQVFVHPGGGFGHGGFHNGGFNRGNFFGGFAFGGFFQQPQFHVQNWQLYGFIAPGPQQRWVRYYDDAYLVDRRGYVHDSRRGVRWDGHGERWGRDQQGIPYYVGRGDYYPDRGDYDRAGGERRWDGDGWDYSGYGSGCGDPRACGSGGHDRHDDRDDRYERDGRHDRDRYDRDGRHDRDGRTVRVERYEHPGGGYADHGDSRVRTRVYTQPGAHAYSSGGSGAYGYSGYPAASYGYGHGAAGYGYGYGGGGTVIVTETTVTPGEVTFTEEIVEEVIEERAVRRRHTPRRRAAPPPRRHHAPSPPRVILPRGDRG